MYIYACHTHHTPYFLHVHTYAHSHKCTYQKMNICTFIDFSNYAYIYIYAVETLYLIVHSDMQFNPPCPCKPEVFVDGVYRQVL